MTDKEAQLKPTQLRELYDALAALKEQEQTALAELHAEDPQRLIARFAHSVETVAGYPALDEPFHDERAALEPMDESGPITSTAMFAARLGAGALHEVPGAPELNFYFADREVFPLRTTKAGGPRPPRRFIDLLLKSGEGYPIVGELKIKADKLTYYALVQALMYAAELSSKSQRDRLVQYYGMQFPDAGPFIGIHLIGYESPERGRFRERSFTASEEIARKLMQEPRVSGVVQHIAYLEAESSPKGLTFRPLFFGAEASSS